MNPKQSPKIIEKRHLSYLNSGVFFLIVGAMASATHFAVFVFLLPYFISSKFEFFGIHFSLYAPEITNLFAFLTAFSVSFIGHRNFSFKDHATSTKTSLLRFFSTAVLGFLINETALIFFHRVLHFQAEISVFFGMLISATSTFIMSRFWAFKK